MSVSLPVLRRRGPDGQRGQSVVELALVVPVMLIILLGIADFARLYATMVTIEAAAREAADFGAFRSDYWLGDVTDPSSNAYKTVQGMTERACVAASDLTGYQGSGSTCSNPSMSWQVLNPGGVATCSDPTNVTPCQVSVTLQYDFDLIVPFVYAPRITFSRTSTFAISDFELDQP